MDKEKYILELKEKAKVTYSLSDYIEHDFLRMLIDNIQRMDEKEFSQYAKVTKLYGYHTVVGKINSKRLK